MSDDCLFCQIARSEVAVHEVFRNEQIVAFMDNGPIRPGHVQIIPTVHFEYFEDIPVEISTEIMQLGQRLARKQKAVLGVERVAFLYTGGDIPHAHAHLVPIVQKDDITSKRYIQEVDLTFQSLPDPGNTALAEIAKSLSIDEASGV